MSTAITSNWQTRLTALFLRMLREDVRNLLPHGVRGVVALVLYGIVVLVAATLDMRASAPGLQIFRWVMWANIVFIYLTSIGYFASAVAEEREEETLGLLLMAGVSPATLLFGKSISRLIAATLVLAAQLPIVSLCTTFGGVLPIQVYAFFLALFCHAVFTSQLALYASVRCRTVLGAGWMTGTLLFVAWIGPWLTQWFLAKIVPSMPFLLPVAKCVDSVHENMLTIRLGNIFTSSFGSSSGQSVLSAMITPHEWGSIVAAIFFFGLAYLRFDRFALSVAEPHALGEPFWVTWFRTQERPSSANQPTTAGSIETPVVIPDQILSHHSPLSSDQRDILVRAAMDRVERKYGVSVRRDVSSWRWPTRGALFAKEWWLVTGGFWGLFKRYAAYLGGALLLIGLLSIALGPPPSRKFFPVWFYMASWAGLIVEGGWNATGIVSVDVRAKAVQPLYMLPVSLWKQVLVKFVVLATSLIPALVLMWMADACLDYRHIWSTRDYMIFQCLAASYVFVLTVTVRGAFVLPRTSPIVGAGLGIVMIFMVMILGESPIGSHLFGSTSAEERLLVFGCLTCCGTVAMIYFTFQEFKRIAAAD